MRQIYRFEPMNSTPTTSLLGIPVFLPTDPQEETDFARLSSAAQELIVDAVLGVYDDGPPSNISESVKEEIAQWCALKPGGRT